jgi:two-component system, cell cycle response regulator
MNILLVEDDPFTTVAMYRVLTQLDHHVTTARNGAEALDLLVENSFAIIISDWMMPEMDGLELCRRVRAAPNETYVYFILLSTKDSYEDRRAALGAGIDDFLVKSLDSEELFSRIAVAQRIMAMQNQLLGYSQQLMEKQKELSSINVDLCEKITVDSLTGLKNHRAFFDELERCYSFAKRQGTPLAVLMIDVDHFKSFNDTHGHLAGDEVLRAVAQMLCSSVRVQDMVARYGGEEFTVILPLSDTDSGMMLAERLRSRIADHAWPLQSVTVSIGIAGCSDIVECAADLVRFADRALYQSKHDGRNCTSIFSFDPAQDGLESVDLAA